MNPYWRNRIQRFPLKLFTREEVHEYLQGSGLAADVQVDIAQNSEGHPLLLALTVDLLRSQEDGAMENDEIPTILSAELLREVASSVHYDALTVLSLLPAADQTMINHFLELPITSTEYHLLSGLSFVRPTPQGLTLHHVVSRLLRDDYARRAPDKFKDLRQKVFQRLAELFHTVDQRLQRRIASHVLELYREFLPSAHAYVNFSSRYKPNEDSRFQPEDLPYLHRFLAASINQSDWQSEFAKSEDYHELLEDIAVHSPEGICVVRDEVGKPLAFCAGIWLHAMTLSLLERYAPGMLGIVGEDLEELRLLPPDTPDTLCVLLAAVDVGHSLYRSEELGALLMQQWLIHMTSGLRGIIVTADVHLNSLLPILGFKQRDSIPIEFGPFDETIVTKWELDFRQTTFDEWVKLVIQQTSPVTEELEAQQSNEAVVDIDGSEAKQILQHLFNIRELEQLSVTKRLNWAGTVIQRKVQELLAAEQPRSPLTPLEQQILRAVYIQKDRNKNQLAEMFHMSRTTFYCHSQTALQHFAYVLTRS